MSLVQCPKCGGQISDTAGKCVHCGFAFKICPDCGAVLAKDAEKCEHCGYVFSICDKSSDKSMEPSEQPAANESNNHDKIANFPNDWCVGTPTKKAIYDRKNATIAEWVFSSILLILIVAMIGVVLSWKNKSNDLDKLLSASHAISVSRTLYWIAIVLIYFRSVFTSVWNVTRVLSCASELSRRNYDGSAFRAETSELIKRKAKERYKDKDWEFKLDSVYLKEMPVEKNPFWARFIFGLFAKIFGWAVFNIMTCIILNNWLFDTNEIAQKEIILLVVFAVLAIAFFIAHICCKYESRRDIWYGEIKKS